jgi:hypothetical protein
MMPANQTRTWLVAVAGSLLLHLTVVGYLLVVRLDLPGWLRVLLGPPPPPAIALSYEKPAEFLTPKDADSPQLATQIREQLARELDAASNQSAEQLAAKLADRRAALDEIPGQHFEEITATLKKVLPGRDFVVTPLTNDTGGVDYLLVYTNAMGGREELLFEDEDRKSGGFLQLAEDPRIAPLLQFVLPLTEVPHTNRPPPPAKAPTK